MIVNLVKSLRHVTFFAYWVPTVAFKMAPKIGPLVVSKVLSVKNVIHLLLSVEIQSKLFHSIHEYVKFLVWPWEQTFFPATYSKSTQQTKLGKMLILNYIAYQRTLRNIQNQL